MEVTDNSNSRHELLELIYIYIYIYILIKKNWVGGGDQSGFPTWA
jgi:hypothetical protein